MTETNSTWTRIKEALPFLALFNLAIVQPLFSTLINGPEFFIYHHVKTAELLMLILFFGFIAPCLLYLLFLLAGGLGTRIQESYRILIFATLSTLLLMPAVKQFDLMPGKILILCIFVLFMLLFSLGYPRLRWIRDFLFYISPAILVVPGIFLFNPQIRKILNTETPPAIAVYPRNEVPIVLVVFDEFPLVSLLNRNLEIDSHMFPNFWRLSQKACFYRNATTVADSTTFSVPAILTGRYPQAGTLPLRSDFPNTLFTLLQDSHSMSATEFGTQLFPDEVKKEQVEKTMNVANVLSDLSIVYAHVVLPADLRSEIPPVTQNWGNFTRVPTIRNPNHRGGRQKTFQNFLSSLTVQKKPILRYLHILLPHRIWEYLPSGRMYDPFEIEHITLDHTVLWANEATLKESYQRCLLQVQYLDGLIEKLINKLEHENLFEPSMIVFVGDHGLGFTKGDKLREVTGGNYPEMLWVPLFIKYPHQETGEILDWNVETADILPTISAVLEFEIPWKVDGYSLLNGAPPRQMKKIVIDSGKMPRIYSADINQIQNSVNRKIAWFGEEDTSNLYQTGPDPWMIGKTVLLNPVSASTAVTVQINQVDRFENVDLESGFLPALLTGLIQSDIFGEERQEIAIAMNGIFCATGYTRPLKKKGRHIFRVMIPESAFVKGFNDVKIFLRCNDGEYLLLKNP